LEGIAEEMEERLALSVKETAASLGLSPWTIRKFIREGKMQTIRLGRRVLIEPSEVRRLIEACRGVPAQADGESRSLAA
jgi:excisionase family DNA binding protein